jgi:hypothetical protein
MRYPKDLDIKIVENAGIGHMDLANEKKSLNNKLDLSSGMVFKHISFPF